MDFQEKLLNFANFDLIFLTGIGTQRGESTNNKKG